MICSNKKLIFILYSSLCILLFSNCNNVNLVESVFDKSPSERVNDEIKKLRTSLTESEKGWMVAYTPWKGTTGTFNLYMKFKSNYEVEAISDLTNEKNKQTLETSEYEIKLGTTVKLVFTTYNPAVHLFTDNSFPPELPGTGLGGSNSFLYYGKNKDADTLYFRSEKRLDTLFFVKNILDNPVDLIKKNITDLKYLNSKLQEGFAKVIVKNADTDTILSESTVALEETLKGISMVRVGNNSSGQRVRLETYNEYFELNNSILKITGYKINQGSKLKNLNIDLSKLILDPNRNNYVSVESTHTENNINYKINLLADTSPIIASEHTTYKEIIKTGKKQYFFKINDKDMPSKYKSATFETLVAETGLGFSQLNLYVDSNQSGRGGTSEQEYLHFSIKQNTTSTTVRDAFDFVDNETYVVLKSTGFLDGSGLTGEKLESYKKLRAILFDSQGWYVSNIGAVTIYSNTIYRFISRGNPNIFFTMYKKV